MRTFDNQPAENHFPPDHPINKLNAIDRMAIIGEVSAEMIKTHLVGQYVGLIAAARLLVEIADGSNMINSSQKAALEAAAITLSNRAEEFAGEILRGEVNMLNEEDDLEEDGDNDALV